MTKDTYHPTAKVKNKFSEIRKYDCGFVYGAEVRKNRVKLQEGKTQNNKKIVNKSRSPMRPHTRKAHWHHYWTGKGRSELVLRWIAPNSGWRRGAAATIHRVR